MSGGVDSAVAAGLLVERGYDVIGVTMKMYAPTRPRHAKSCCGASDFDDARRSAVTLGIPHYVLDFEETFRRNVIDRFVDAYHNGRTPNPCIACNNFVKLGTLTRFGAHLGARFVATGHYARVVHAADGPHLFAGNPTKDQSYALAQLSATQLAGLLLPLGELDKKQTRWHAARLGLTVADKAESQEICFVEGGDYRDVLARGSDEGICHPERSAPSLSRGAESRGRRGPVITTEGRQVGTHSGISQFTVGQRRGLPATHFNDGPRYVTRIDAATNTIVIGREDELASWALVAGELNLIRPERFADGPFRVKTMTRYRVPTNFARASCDVVRDELHLEFERPERAVAPGQLVAMYDGDEVLGAATIRAAA